MGLNRDFKDVATLAGIPLTRVPILRVRLYDKSSVRDGQFITSLHSYKVHLFQDICLFPALELVHSFRLKGVALWLLAHYDFYIVRIVRTSSVCYKYRGERY